LSRPNEYNRLQEQPHAQGPNPSLVVVPGYKPSPQWQALTDAYLRHFDKPDMQAVKAVYAAFAAHELVTGKQVWTFLVGPPGSLKTVLLSSLDGLPHTHTVDSITTKTFISGYQPAEQEKDEEPSGLLFRIGPSGKLIFADFSTILSLKRDHLASILADLRRIYDGRLSKQFGTGKKMEDREWRGRLSVMAAVTGDIDRHFSVFKELGERFLMVRWPRAGREAARLAIKQDGEAVDREISQAARALLKDLEQVSPVVPRDMEETRIPALGDFAAFCRSPVTREHHGAKNIVNVPEAESATRISQQLCQLAKGSALLDRRSTVNEQDWELIQRVAFDCMLPARRKVVDSLIHNLRTTWGIEGYTDGRAARREKAELDKLPESTRRYAAGDLEALGVLENGKLSGRSVEQLVEAGLLGDFG